MNIQLSISQSFSMIQKNKKSKLLIVVLCLCYIILYGPLLLIVLQSFNVSTNVMDFNSYSFNNYTIFFQSKQFLQAIKNSTKIALASSTISVILGTLMAIAFVQNTQKKITYTHSKYIRFLSLLFSIPLVTPDIIMGLGLATVFLAMKNIIGWPISYNIYTVIIAHATIGIAYVKEIVQAKLISLDPSLAEAAMNLKTKPIKIFLTITLPLIWPSIFFGWTLSMILSFDDVIIASFVSGYDSTTLSMLIFSSIKFGQAANIDVLCSIILIILSLAVIIFFIVMKIRAKQTQNIAK